MKLYDWSQTEVRIANIRMVKERTQKYAGEKYEIIGYVYKTKVRISKVRTYAKCSKG